MKSNIKLIIQYSFHISPQYYITLGRVGALPLFPHAMLFHRQLCFSNSHWCTTLISKNQSITRSYLFCEKQVFTFHPDSRLSPQRAMRFL